MSEGLAGLFGRLLDIVDMKMALPQELPSRISHAEKRIDQEISWLMTDILDYENAGGVRYWSHAESDCVFTTFGYAEHRAAANSGCDEISRERYLEFEVGGLI